MCGFTVLYAHQSINNTTLEKLKNCNAEMHYRGPDESDLWHDDFVAMAHVRLSIIGLKNGHQPIYNEDKSLILVCNGEIYNYKKLQLELIKLGHTFNTNSDNEVIVHLYEEYGTLFNEKLDGMFAYCIYDKKKRRLILGRDHAGKKPLYYSNTAEGIIFSSELKVIKKYFLNNSNLNFEILRQIQKYSYSISPEETYIENIKKIPYSCFATFNLEEGLIINSYFKRIITPSFEGNYFDACQIIKSLIFKSVEKRMLSEVPIAILLSAGIDSSIIAAISKEFSNEINVISAGYHGKNSVDERAEAKKFSDYMGFRWNEIELDELNYKNSLEEILYYIDEPNADVAMFAQWGLYKEAKKLGFKVLLSGNGGDELFYGYKSHNNHALGLEWLINQNRKFPLKNKKQFLKYILQLASDFYFNKKESFFKNFNIKDQSQVFDELNLRVENYKLPLEREDWYRGNEFYFIDKIYYYLHYAWLTNNCYLLSDKLAMAHSIEVRNPFSDINLIQFIDTLPLEIKFKNNTPKQLLKDSLEGVVPNHIFDRKKTGFTPPSLFIKNIVESYQPKYFKQQPTNFSHLVTDFFASNL